MPSNLTSNLHSHFGFSSFRPGQEEAIQSLLAGNHTLVVMPTGAGKSLIFQLAAMHFNGLTLVISPLIALMKDQVDGLTRRNIPATYINSTLESSEQNLRLQKLAQGKYKLVYIAPERLRNVPFLNEIKKQTISLLVVDEAHCISEWGHDFRPDYLHIAQARASLGNPLTMALTATATPQVQKDIIRLLGLGDATCVVTGFNRPNLTLDVRYVSGLPSKLRILTELFSDGQKGATIIYTGTRRDAEEVTEFAREIVKIPTEFYHAGLVSEERNRIQNDFISGKLNVIAATNAFGMGIDRTDVRQVVHYSLPGSLEAYYQEAGRAGRDGRPARATLLYDPRDRALQEFFIANSVIATNDLHALHNAIHNGEQTWVTLDDLSRVTGLHPVQVKVGLAELERAGALAHLGDEGFRILFRRGAWNQDEIEKVAIHSKEHINHRRAQLERIVQYAESNSCRRKIILNYFGDTGEAQIEDCCDNCQGARVGQVLGKEPGEMSHGERAALIILDCIRRVHIKVGQEKLAQILHGSKARAILKFHHDKNEYYGRLAGLRLNEIKGMISKLIEMGYIKIIGSRLPTLRLTPRGENAVNQRDVISIEIPKFFETSEKIRARAKFSQKGGVEDTAKLLICGLQPKEIAEKRGLATTTIYDHLAQLIAGGRISVDQVVPKDISNQIEKAIEEVGTTRYLSPIKALLPDAINYEIIRCVAAGYNLHTTKIPKASVTTNYSSMTANHVVELGESKSPDVIPELICALESDSANVRRLAASALGKIRDTSAIEPLLNLLEREAKPQVRQYIVKALGTIGDTRAENLLTRIASSDNEIYYTRDAARAAIKQLHRTLTKSTHPAPLSNYEIQDMKHASPTSPPDNIDSFLAKPHPRPLAGPWHMGWALDFNSRFSGGDWSRSYVGDLIYRLKYESDTSVLPVLIQQTLDLFHAYPEMNKVDVIIPVPSSTERKVNPVYVFCEALAGKIDVPMQTLVAKTRQTQPQKELRTLAQKRANVSGAFSLQGDVRRKSILLIDDLFDSGATLNEITRLFLTHGATRINVLTLTRTIHSDA